MLDADMPQGFQHLDRIPKPAEICRIPIGTDLEIAQMVAFLASDLASFTTGAYIPVSGGRVMPAI
ncbi:MAG: SDR family oxidoreductase [Ruminococcus sp.]|nr:SDR family oxidoreductase [Ruminococcus sp.]